MGYLRTRDDIDGKMKKGVKELVSDGEDEAGEDGGPVKKNPKPRKTPPPKKDP